MQEFDDKKIEQLNTLMELTRLINSTLDLHLVVKRAISAATRLLGAEAGSLLLIDQDTDELFFETALGSKGNRVKSMRLTKGVGIAGWVADHGKPALVNDVNLDERFFKGIDEQSGFMTKSMVSVPLKLKGNIIGVLQVINKINGTFDNDDVVVLYTLANQVAIALENARLYKDSITDYLTGLYHHKFFSLRLREEWERAKRYHYSLGLLFIDIDHFKEVNDNLGHLVGSKTIVELSRLLLKSLRTVDIVSRYGGDEFEILLPYTSYSGAKMVAERLREGVEEATFDDIKVTISVGLTFFDGSDSEITPDQFIENADKALYKAKENGRNRVETLLFESSREKTAEN